MNVVDLWSIITGLASIVSLIFAFNDKFEHWKKYTLPTVWGFAGFAVGRLSMNASNSINALSQDSHSMGVLIMLASIVGAALTCFVILMKSKEVYYAYVIFWMLLSFSAPTLIKAYSSANPVIPNGDYLQLVRLKEENGNMEEAIRYYQLFVSKTNDNGLEKQLDDKIAALRKAQVSESLNLSSNKAERK